GRSGDGGRPVGAGQDRHQGDDDDADQGMLAMDRGARVLQLLEVACDLVQTDPPNIRHGSSSVGCRKGSDPENDRQAIIGSELGPDRHVYPKLALALGGPARGFRSPDDSPLGSLRKPTFSTTDTWQRTTDYEPIQRLSKSPGASLASHRPIRYSW